MYNVNYLGDKLGVNLFRCNSSDGYYSAILRAQGNIGAGGVFAKQFAEDGNLKGIGSWFEYCNADIGDQVEVRWTSPFDMVITYLGKSHYQSSRSTSK